jgi:hypothetical protein
VCALCAATLKAITPMPMYRGIAGDILDELEQHYYRQREPGTNKPVYTNKVTLTFKRDELLYDIRNIAYVEGDVMPADSEHDRHQVMDVGEDGNIDRVTRVLDVAFAECVEFLYPYSKQEVATEESRDDVLATTEEYVMVLKVPDDFSKTTVDLMEKYIHEFLVYMVLVDWMSITNLKNAGSAQNWQAKLDVIKDEIESTLNAKRYRVRRTMHPFDNSL